MQNKVVVYFHTNKKKFTFRFIILCTIQHISNACIFLYMFQTFQSDAAFVLLGKKVLIKVQNSLYLFGKYYIVVSY